MLLSTPALVAKGSRPLDAIERSYIDLLDLRDRIAIARGRGTTTVDLKIRYSAARGSLVQAVNADVPGLSPSDRRALERIRSSMREGLAEDVGVEEPATAKGASCPVTWSADVGVEDLQRRLYACYGETARSLSLEGKTYDRLTLLEMAARDGSRERRREIFLALDPLFKSVNGDNAGASPYRALLPLSAERWRKEGSPIDRNLKALGIDPNTLEPWLVSILDAWRETTAGEDLEPWDYEYSANAAGRTLAEHIPAGRLRRINDVFYRSLGADVQALNIHYDLEPRAGKTPVAFTDFGARPRRSGRTWTPGEPWIFATYGAGGLGNLAELLHETGHAIHIAAIRTRPAYTDWPDSDTFTEALADVAALEAYEPEWQRRYLGAAATLADSLKAKYSGIVLDVAWGLFELRLHRDPAADPNALWTDLTSRYLHVKPHPALSWWARRGQLVDSPGYMMNYALGAILVADMRERCRSGRGSMSREDRGTYRWLSDRLYRFGLERTSGDVIRDFLGRPPTPAALLADMRRAAPAAR